MLFKKVDLHMHTTVSDGTDSLEEIIENVHKAGVDLFAVTDHDAIKGGCMIPQLLAKMDEANRPRPSFIRGVEFSCEDELGKYHILGYGYDPKIKGITDVVEQGHKLRMKKTAARLEFIQEEFGFEFSDEEIAELLARDNPGKPHIANLMIKHGYATTKSEAIDNYIDKKEFHNEHVRPEVAIKGILQSGGIPVLAHPAYGDGDDLILGEEMNERLKHLMDFGLQGMEAFYSGFTPRIQMQMLGFALLHGLYVTAGSDYHGKNKMIEIGWTNLNDMAIMPKGMRRFLKDVEII